MRDLEKIIDERDIIAKLKQNEEIDCIAIVVSSWHYLNALAAIDYLRDQGRVRKSIILACRHGKNGYIVDQKLWNKDRELTEKYYVKFHSLPSWGKVVKYLSSKTDIQSNFYILRSVGASPELAAALWNAGLHKNYVSVVIDEGLAYYLRSIKGWLCENANISYSPKFLFHRVIKEWIYQCYTNLSLKMHGQLLHNTFFIKKYGQLYINDICTKYLRNVLEDLSCLYDYTDYAVYENKLIICTQVFHDLEQIANNADIIAIKQICAQASRYNIGVIIKPHPRETNLNKYRTLGAIVDENNRVPLEIMLAGLMQKPLALLGITTTSLVTANVLWGIESFSMIEMIGKENFRQDVLEDIHHFPKTFFRYVTILKTVDEIFANLQKGDA